MFDPILEIPFGRWNIINKRDIRVFNHSINSLISKIDTITPSDSNTYNYMSASKY